MAKNQSTFHVVIAVCSFFALTEEATARQTTTPVPDLSGVWGRNSVDFEPPSSGPGPVANTARLPDGSRDVDRLIGDHTNPILKPEAAEVVRRHGAISVAGTNYPTPGNQCRPAPPPFILNQMEIQIVQHRDRVYILYLFGHHVRRVYLNEAHPVGMTPSWYGHSVGHYEGDTLVVDTVGMRLGPLSMVDDYGTPHTEGLHVVERYRLIDGEVARQIAERNEKEFGSIPPDIEGITIDPNYTGKGLQIQFAVSDPGAFTTEWSGSVTYRRTSNPWDERVCAENTHEYYANRDTAVPRDDTPDF